MTWGAIGGGGGGTPSATYTVTESLILGAATTSGVRLDLESGRLAVREGDDSAAADLLASAFYAGGNTSGAAYKSDRITYGASPALSLVLYFSDQLLIQGGSGQRTSTACVGTTSSALTSGASYTFTGALPAGAIILGVTARITTTVTGPTSVQIGDGTDADRYGEFSTLTAGQTLTPADGTASPLEWRSAAGDVVLTAVGGNFTAGVVRISVHYLACTAPTS